MLVEQQTSHARLNILALLVRKLEGVLLKKQKPMKKPPSKWRKEHEDFISGLRAARQYSSKNSMQTQLQGRFMGGSQQSKYSGGGPSKYQSQQPKPYSSQKKQQQKYNDDDDYDPFAYKQKVTSTQKQVQRKQFNPDTHQAPSTVKTTKKANTTAKKPYQYNQLNDDIQMGGGGSYLEKLEQQYKRNTPAKPIQNVGGASKYGNSGPGGGGRGGGVLDPTSNAHSRNLIFADSGYGSTYQPSYQDQWATTYTNAYADSKPKQNAFSVPGQQKTYIDTPYQTQLNQGGAQQYNQRQQPYGCLLYTSDAADEEDSVDLCGCRNIKKKKQKQKLTKKTRPTPTSNKARVRHNMNEDR
eukprot:TRINITY_DN7724_c0_g1_i1.p1 TRINITY_DN7724_c0_g1~~TRINITY_DN7724_c0_g1_i1.p1  ORF type:complete len:354 (-),score=52.42 TRINITY_DN7724_c0_g1_i1:9-1070(-)